MAFEHKEFSNKLSELMKVVADAHEARERAQAISEAKIALLKAALTTPMDDKEIEKARQECIDAFSASVDTHIEGCKKIEACKPKMGI